MTRMPWPKADRYVRGVAVQDTAQGSSARLTVTLCSAAHFSTTIKVQQPASRSTKLPC